MVKVKSSVEPKKQNKRKSNINKKSSKVKKQPVKNLRRRKGIQKKTKAGVVYLTHIPHGFYEEQIQAYFNQFGKVTAVSVPRSKSGRVKGYAFIEYKHPEIAQIAADTMNNYLMFNRLLKAEYIPPEKQKPFLFDLAKAAQENCTSLAQKAFLAKENYSKRKNRQLKLQGEAKLAAKLLKKKDSLSKRLENFDFLVEEANIYSIFERKNKMEKLKKIKREKEEKDSPEKQLSSTKTKIKMVGNKDSITKSWGDIFLDCVDEDDPSESGKEDHKKIVSKAKYAAKYISKKEFKTPKNQNKKKNSEAVPVKLDPTVEDSISEKNITSKVNKPRKRLGKNASSLTEKIPSAKKSKNVAQTPSNKESVTPQMVMKAANTDKAIDCEAPPKAITNLIKAGKDSSNETPKSTIKSSLKPNQISSSEKPLKVYQSESIKISGISLAEFKARRKTIEALLENVSPVDKSTSPAPLTQTVTDSPGKSEKVMKAHVATVSPKTPTGRKLRHRKLKQLLNSQ